MEMIALDDQPFSIVEDRGFRRLIENIEPRYSMSSRRYFSDVSLPALYEVVATHIHKLLDNVTDISFTTDIWSLDVSQMSMLSLTAKWVDDNFEMKRAVLHAQEFAGSHMGSPSLAHLTACLLCGKFKKTMCMLYFMTMRGICRRHWRSTAWKAWAAWLIHCSQQCMMEC